MTFIICTKEHPWAPILREVARVVHPDARQIGDQRDGWPSGDLVTMRCPHCGHEWEKELPQ